MLILYLKYTYYNGKMYLLNYFNLKKRELIQFFFTTKTMLKKEPNNKIENE